jgi:gluconolactonase
MACVFRDRGQNDLVFDREGGFWFTDHGTGNADGGLFYAKADGSSITCWKDHQTAPNGVGLSPDERTVYFADTRPSRVWAFDLISPGMLAGQPRPQNGLLVELPEGNLFDSLAVEAGGRVCVGTLINGGITVCALDGTARSGGRARD